MRISDWSSDVCSSDLSDPAFIKAGSGISAVAGGSAAKTLCLLIYPSVKPVMTVSTITAAIPLHAKRQRLAATVKDGITSNTAMSSRSEEHTSELQSLMRISYDVFCLKQKKTPT